MEEPTFDECNLTEFELNDPSSIEDLNDWRLDFDDSSEDLSFGETDDECSDSEKETREYYPANDSSPVKVTSQAIWQPTPSVSDQLKYGAAILNHCSMGGIGPETSAELFVAQGIVISNR